MLRSQFRIFSKSFQTFSKIQGSSLKEKLNNLQQRQVVLNKSSKELARLEAKKRLDIKRIQKKAYPRHRAIKLIQKQNEDLDQDLKTAAVGPTSDNDLKFLVRTKDKRLIYSILGITGQQLRDSLLITKDVKKFLKRGQVEKAVMLTRLAKHRGSAGMNAIMQYFFEDLRMPQSAVNMYNWRKKWGIPPNEFTNTILFNGLAKQKGPIRKDNAELVLKTVERLIENENLTQIEYNAALGALSNSDNITYAFKLFERKIKGVKRDSISYLWILRTCKKIESDPLFQEVIKDVIEDTPSRLVDAPLLFEFCKTLNSRNGNYKIQSLTTLALKEYFKIDLDTDLWPQSSGTLQLLPLSHWSIEQRFPLNAPVIGLFLDNCLYSRHYELGLKFFEDLKSKKNKILDLGMYHRYMELQIKTNPLNCGDKCLTVFEELESNPKLVSSKHSLLLLYKAFQKQATKKANNTDTSKIDQFLYKCLQIIKETEGFYSKEFRTRLYHSKSWQFIFTIVKAANSNNALSTRAISTVIDEYLKSAIQGEFSATSFRNNRENIETLRFITLECVRLLNQLAFRMSIPGIDGVDLTKPSLERTIFLQRRQIRQFKNLLLGYVEILESSKPDIIKINQHNHKIKEKASNVLSDHESSDYLNYVLKR